MNGLFILDFSINQTYRHNPESNSSKYSDVILSNFQSFTFILKIHFTKSPAHVAFYVRFFAM